HRWPRLRRGRWCARRAQERARLCAPYNGFKLSGEAAKNGTPHDNVSAAVTIDTSNGIGGVLTWTYEVATAKVEYLAAGAQRIETFDLPAKDSHAGNVPRPASVTLTGTNDGALPAKVDLNDAIAETAGIPAPGAQLSDSGTAAFADVDVADTHSVPVS